MKKMTQNLVFEKPRAKSAGSYCLTFKKTNIPREIIDNRRSSAKTTEREKGFALVIALGIVALISILTISMTSILLQSVKNAQNLESSNEAYYAAEAGLEMALLANKNQKAGFETSGTVDYTDINGSKANWILQGQTTCLLTNASDATSCADTDTYYIPRPGTGSAGTNCDPLQTYSDSDKDGSPDANHSCNWERIDVGQNISIPLHRVTLPGEEFIDINSDGVLDPAELGITSIKLRIRTPCEDGKPDCDDNDRYDLDTFYDTTFLQGDTIMLWEIIG